MDATLSSVSRERGITPPVLADRHLLTEALYAVLSNALHASSPGDKVHVNVAAEAGELVIRVRDRGEGMPSVALAQAFEPFARFRREPSAGPGIGLALARASSEAIGGTMWLETTESQGTLCSLRLPCQETATEIG